MCIRYKGRGVWSRLYKGIRALSFRLDLEKQLNIDIVYSLTESKTRVLTDVGLLTEHLQGAHRSEAEQGGEEFHRSGVRSAPSSDENTNFNFVAKSGLLCFI